MFEAIFTGVWIFGMLILLAFLIAKSESDYFNK
jgi:hypothetical protein